MQNDVEQLTADNTRFRQALERIANPVKYMQAEAEREGNELNGAMAFQLSNDPEYLKRIAELALAN
ncbi:MAG: hypothetical protein CMB80_08780 [Flammeovirgaceae bacterium]|nr:hypothetical protein [Flammeovirgaceae bacterium]|tara:strand:+ start:4317 stop:4514 length:198 start_codon:yes stop_codon:yes gene_type:complete